MSRELLIVFVYDPRFCTTEADDPQNSILYFHPPWVSSTQKLALSGQLMGIVKFSSSVFSTPSVLALRSGKFAIRHFGSSTLCVGTDRNIPDSILQNRADTLYNILVTYHFNITEISDHKILCEQLNTVISSYLSLLLVSSNMFSTTAVLKFPKSGGNILLEAMQILESMQEKNKVLGGMLLHQNKIVVTQFGFELTKLIQLTNPFCNKIPAENVKGSFHLPLGTQILYIFVDREQVLQIRKTATSLKESVKKVSRWRQKNKMAYKSQDYLKTNKNPENKNMFTVEEEDTPDSNSGSICSMPDIVKESIIKAEKKLEKSSTGKCSSLESSLNEMPNFSKLVTLRKDTTRYQSLRLLPKTTNNNNLKYNDKYRTLCDPYFPLLRDDDYAVSKALYDKQLSQHYTDLDFKAQTEKEKILKSKKPVRPTSIPLNLQALDRKPALKEDIMTPLMAKLSMTESYNFVTPTESICRTPTSFQLQTNPVSHQKLLLFVAGFQNTSIMVLLEKEAENDAELIHLLWNLSFNNLGDLEHSINNTITNVPDAYNLQGTDETYGYMVMDTTNAGMIDKHGNWLGSQTILATSIHDTFQKKPSVLDIIIRNDDNIVYGNKCGSRELFYQQNGNIVSGLPTPSDIMGVVSTTAKRRLQRDHGIIIL
ncbi:Hermansky-Pudlak syndrome 4 protein homolog [Melanaphis sacchari]|uniref:Hermansky-Pudlak syndrome 4 protein n=1 Tax=Melanaphis sacchari TaxID=742174 RepID=A0A2H8TR27_9HEMI|nr:Hermansky-Pudlak syndrome 4 protein homolog [Melanaphis sacchari]